MSFEKEYEDIMQNIEFTIIQKYRQDPNLLDCNVADSVGALIRVYRAEQGGRTITLPRMAERTQVLYEAVRTMCEWRLVQVLSDSRKMSEIKKPVMLEEMISCLKRIEKSVKLWNKQNGRQGYLDFANKFII